MSVVKKGTQYYSEQVDRHGTPVYYYRRPGFPKIRLNAKPGTPAMDREYFYAKEKVDKLAADKEAGIVADPDRPMVVCTPTKRPEYIRQFGDTAQPGAEGTLRWGVDRFEAGHLRSAKPHTRQCYMINLRRVCSMRSSDDTMAWGDALLSTIEPEHITAVQKRIGESNGKPTADGTVKHLRAMFNWLKRAKLFKGDNPAANASWLHPYNDKNAGWATWELSHIEDFFHTHPIGTAAHTALGLILYAGLRITDVGEMSRFNEKKGGTELHWIESKSRDSTVEGNHRPENKPRELAIVPELRAILDAAHAKFPDARALVCQDNGKPYTRSSIQKTFKRWCEEAGLPDNLAAHGGRKAAASMIFGETGNEAHLCSVFGWTIGSDMARVYARKYDQRKAQQAAMSGLRRAMTEAA